MERGGITRPITETTEKYARTGAKPVRSAEAGRDLDQAEEFAEVRCRRSLLLELRGSAHSIGDGLRSHTRHQRAPVVDAELAHRQHRE